MHSPAVAVAVERLTFVVVEVVVVVRLLQAAAVAVLGRGVAGTDPYWQELATMH